jgi:DNA-binding CsgD family transcriptional regulator
MTTPNHAEQIARLRQQIVELEAEQWGLTARETEVWEWRSRGLSYAEIAEKLYICRNTVRNHLKSIYSKQI